jgi:hypothetical protein
MTMQAVVCSMVDLAAAPDGKRTGPAALAAGPVSKVV